MTDPTFVPALGVFVPPYGDPDGSLTETLHPTKSLAELFAELFAKEEAIKGGTETRLQVLERVSKARSAQIKADMEASEAAGTLWTVHAGMYPGKVHVVLCHGRVDDDTCLGHHNLAPAVFGPLHLIGKTHREAMFETFKLFTVDKIEITTIR